MRHRDTGDTEPPDQAPAKGAGATLYVVNGGAGAEAAGPGLLSRGALLGRYVILRHIGSGGMGVVYQAYDPKLDRQIVVKLLRTGGGAASTSEAARVRLAREAQALAKLAHPNVVTVYDVGAVDDEVYIAMEFVDGVTLHDWLKAQRRSRSEIVQAFLAAGRGLAAAHRAGLVHRDFKPDNVLVSEDGRIRVLDFGLAMLEKHEPHTPSVAGQAGDALGTTAIDDGRGALRTPVTQVGARLGTPRYMAPEQHMGQEDVDARADQFGFCVALHHALYGVYPFAGDTYTTLMLSTISGKVKEPPAGSDVPARLRAVIVRGLRPIPDARHASMDALLDELQRVTTRRSRTVLALAVAVAVLAAVALSLFVVLRGAAPGPADMRCQGMDEKLVGVWDAERAEAVRTAFVASGRPYAADTFKRVAERLDGYTRDWAAARGEVCRATQMRGEQSAEVLDLRMGCLDRRLAEVRALVTVFAKGPSVEVLDRAAEAAARLAPLSACDDVEALQAAVTAVPPPADPETRARVDALRGELAEAQALEETGQYPAGLAVAQEASPEADRIGYPPVQAALLFARARLELATGDAKAAEGTFEQALMAAAGAHDDAMTARIWPALITAIGSRLARPDEAMRLRPRAEVALVRADGDPGAEASFLTSMGQVSEVQGNYDEARRLHERSLALREKTLGANHLDVARSLNELGNVLGVMGKYDEALRHHARALAIRERVLGPDHPEVAKSLTNLGNVYYAQGKYEEAARQHARALAILENALGPDHPDVAAVLFNLGAAFLDQGKYDEAGRRYLRVLAIWERVLGPDHPDVALCLSSLGVLSEAQGRYDEALRYQHRALAIRQQALAPDHPQVARSLSNVGRVLLLEGKYDEAGRQLERARVLLEKAYGADHPALADALDKLGDLYQAQGKHDDARRHYARALAIQEKALGPDHPDLGDTLTGLATALLSLGRLEEARAQVERAVRIGEAAGQPNVAELAEGRFVLARVLWAVGYARPRALALARQARDGFMAGGAVSKKKLARVDSWLAGGDRR